MHLLRTIAQSLCPIVAISCVTVVGASAQTAMATYNCVGLPLSRPRTDRQMAPNNLWLPSAQIGFKLLETGGLSSVLLVSAQLLYEVPLESTSFHLPVMGNIGQLAADVAGKTSDDSLLANTSALLSKAEGLNVSFEPYWVGAQKPNLIGTFFGRAGIKANDLADEAGEKHLLIQGRFGAGYEIQIGKQNSTTRPLTISLLGGLNTFSASTYQKVFGASRGHLWNGELTMMIPISESGTGLILEGVTAEQHSPSWRLGFLISKPVKGDETSRDSRWQFKPTPI